MDRNTFKATSNYYVFDETRMYWLRQLRSHLDAIKNDSSYSRMLSNAMEGVVKISFDHEYEVTEKELIDGI